MLLNLLVMNVFFSSEKDKYAIETYWKNFPSHNPFFDMDLLIDMDAKKIDKIIPNHDILCAGFPCQPFSVGGIKKGFSDNRGVQFFNILKILKVKKPKYIILENVKHFANHNKGETFKIINMELKKIGYDVGQKPIIMSPESLGIPHRRERSFMYAKINTKHKKISIPFKKEFDNSIKKIFSFSKNKESDLTLVEKKAIYAWEDFLNILKIKPPIIWLDQMINNEWNDNWQKWKKNYVLNMRKFYFDNKQKIDKWLKKHEIMLISNVKYRRLEWLCGKDYDFTLKNKIITIRQSGVRVSRPKVFPTLVASVETPITFDYKLKDFRKMTIKEMCKLQSFPPNFIPSKNSYQAKKQLGNSVNVNVVKYIAKEIL